METISTTTTTTEFRPQPNKEAQKAKREELDRGMVRALVSSLSLPPFSCVTL